MSTLFAQPIISFTLLLCLIPISKPLRTSIVHLLLQCVWVSLIWLKDNGKEGRASSHIQLADKALLAKKGTFLKIFQTLGYYTTLFKKVSDMRMSNWWKWNCSFKLKSTYDINEHLTRICMIVFYTSRALALPLASSYLTTLFYRTCLGWLWFQVGWPSGPSGYVMILYAIAIVLYFQRLLQHSEFACSHTHSKCCSRSLSIWQRLKT